VRVRVRARARARARARVRARARARVRVRVSASVRVARRLACVDERHVAVRVVLQVQLVEHARRVPVALVGEQADDELGAHGLS
jgi:forkhead box protein K